MWRQNLWGLSLQHPTNITLVNGLHVNHSWNFHEYASPLDPEEGSAECRSLPFQLILMTNSQLTMTDVTSAPSAGQSTIKLKDESRAEQVGTWEQELLSVKIC